MHVVQSLPSITTLPLQSVSTAPVVSTAAHLGSTAPVPSLSRTALAVLVPEFHAPYRYSAFLSKRQPSPLHTFVPQAAPPLPQGGQSHRSAFVWPGSA